VFAFAWYFAFGFEVLFHYHNPHIDWAEVSVAALISFVVGWGAVHLIGWLISAPGS